MIYTYKYNNINISAKFYYHNNHHHLSCDDMYKPKKNDTILFGCSGFFGPIILDHYPNIVAAGRTPPPKFIKNKFVKIKDIKNINKIRNFNYKNVIFLIGNSHHSDLNSNNLEKALSYNFYPFN